MSLAVDTSPIIARTTPSPAGTGDGARALRQARTPFSEPVAKDLDHMQASLDYIHRALRQNNPVVNEIIVRDEQGRVVAALGDFIFNGVQTSGGLFAELYAGFPLNISDPSTAVLSVTPDGHIRIGNKGYVDVVDPFGKSAAWLGTQNDTLAVTGAIDNGSGLIRLTVTAHTLATGDVAQVLYVGGVPNATGVFTITNVDANHVDLQQSVFDGLYTSGGTIDRILHVTGAIAAAGLIRLTLAVAHGFTTGDQVDVHNVGGVPNATGQWVVKVVDATHIDLLGSAFAGGYTSGGSLVRYFAGGYFQTIGVGGTSWANAKLKAQANGDLDITNALIMLVGSAATITLDPVTGFISVVDTAMTMQTIINAVGVAVESLSDGKTSAIGVGTVSVYDGGGVLRVSLTYNNGVDTSIGYKVGGVPIVDNARVADFTTLKINGTVVVDGSRNVNAASYAVGGAPGILKATGGIHSISTSVLQYKDWSGTNQSATVVTSITQDLLGFTSGLLTSSA